MRKILLIIILFSATLTRAQNTTPAYLDVHKYDSAEAALTVVYNQDQAYRGGIDSTQRKYGWRSPQMIKLLKVIHQNDSTNLLKVRHSLDTYGWLGIDEVGEKASMAQFLVIQHADSLTQVTYLPVMQEAVKKGKAAPDQLALLEDRVLCTQGKPQIYGSQVRSNAKGKYEFYPIKDEAGVDQRRASVGLDPLENYARGFGIDYHLPKAPAH